MAFHDPLEFSPTGEVEDTLDVPRVSTGTNTSTYSTPDGLYVIRAEHAYARRTRRVIRVDTNKVTPDPFIPAQNVKVSGSIYTVVDIPVAGFDQTELVGLYKGLSLMLTSSSDHVLKEFLGGQS